MIKRIVEQIVCKPCRTTDQTVYYSYENAFLKWGIALINTADSCLVQAQLKILSGVLVNFY